MPHDAMPAAMVIMFFSAMPRLKKRSGWRAAKSRVRLALARSAVSTTMRGSLSAMSASSSPRMKAGMAAFGVPRTERASLKLSPFSFASPPPVPRKIASWPCVSSAFRRSARCLATLLLRSLARLQAGADFRFGLVVILARQVRDVPLQRQFHALDAAALDGVRHDQLRLAGAGRRQLAQRAEDGVEIVPVDALRRPAERGE